MPRHQGGLSGEWNDAKQRHCLHGGMRGVRILSWPTAFGTGLLELSQSLLRGESWKHFITADCTGNPSVFPRPRLLGHTLFGDYMSS